MHPGPWVRRRNHQIIGTYTTGRRAPLSITRYRKSNVYYISTTHVYSYYDIYHKPNKLQIILLSNINDLIKKSPLCDSKMALLVSGGRGAFYACFIKKGSFIPA